MNARTSLISRLVGFCADHAWIVVAIALVQAVAVTGYSISHFAMSTDTRELISPKLDWRVREAALNTLFPPTGSQIVVVIDGHTPELTEQAAAEHLLGGHLQNLVLQRRGTQIRNQEVHLTP